MTDSDVAGLLASAPGLAFPDPTVAALVARTLDAAPSRDDR